MIDPAATSGLQDSGAKSRTVLGISLFLTPPLSDSRCLAVLLAHELIARRLGLSPSKAFRSSDTRNGPLCC